MKESKTQQLENNLETYRKTVFILNATPGPMLENSPSESLLPCQLAGAWIQCPIKIGHPHKSCRNLFVTTLKEIIPDNVDKQGKFKDFLALAKNEILWDNKLKEYEERIIETSQENNEIIGENENDDDPNNRIRTE